MSKTKAPKQLIIGWKIILKVLLEAGISKEHAKGLLPIWIDVYSSKPGFNPKEISHRMIAGMQGSPLSEEKLYQKLELAKNTYAHLLTDISKLTEEMDPELVIFNALVDNIVLRIKEQVNIAYLSEDLLDQLMKLKLSESALIEVSRWCNRLASPIPEESMIALNIKDSKIIVHYLYIWVCEEIGPALADQLFSDSIRKVDALPEASQCPPKSFL